TGQGYYFFSTAKTSWCVDQSGRKAKCPLLHADGNLLAHQFHFFFGGRAIIFADNQPSNGAMSNKTAKVDGWGQGCYFCKMLLQWQRRTAVIAADHSRYALTNQIFCIRPGQNTFSGVVGICVAVNINKAGSNCQSIHIKDVVSFVVAQIANSSNAVADNGQISLTRGLVGTVIKNTTAQNNVVSSSGCYLISSV